MRHVSARDVSARHLAVRRALPALAWVGTALGSDAGTGRLTLRQATPQLRRERCGLEEWDECGMATRLRCLASPNCSNASGGPHRFPKANPPAPINPPRLSLPRT